MSNITQPHFTRTFTAMPADIDQLGHVNNTVWVRWVQDMATAHWEAQALPEHIAAYIWVVVRHEIDFLGNIVSGQSVDARTWVSDPPTGAKMNRNVEFTHADKVIVRAKTTWAIVDTVQRRILRVPAAVAVRFLPTA
jgi:acyl-CoA thioester hydrolase